MKSHLNSIVDWLIQNENINEEDRDVYYFGLRQSVIYLMNILTFLIIAISFGMLWSVGVFLIIYMVLRQYAGGYHAETDFGCYLSSTAVIIIVAYILKQYHISLNTTMIILILSTIAIVVLGPVEDHHKPLDYMEVKVYSKRMRLLLFGELIIITISKLLGYNLIAEAATISIAVVGLAVVIGWIKNRYMAARQ